MDFNIPLHFEMIKVANKAAYKGRTDTPQLFIPTGLPHTVEPGHCYNMAQPSCLLASLHYCIERHLEISFRLFLHKTLKIETQLVTRHLLW
jgi:hypothetical protein